MFLSWPRFFCLQSPLVVFVGRKGKAVTFTEPLLCAGCLCSSSRPEEGATINSISRGGNLDETGNSDTQVSLDPFFIIVSRQLRSLFSKQSIADELCPLEEGDGEERVPGLKSQEIAGRVPHLPRVPMTLSEPLLLSACKFSDLGQGWRWTADACPSSPLAGQPPSTHEEFESGFVNGRFVPHNRQKEEPSDKAGKANTIGTEAGMEASCPSQM